MKVIALIIGGLAALFSLPAAAETATHPLAGKIVDTRTGAIVHLDDPALIPKLFPCGAITLLGEVHDNADHHRLRAGLIKSAAAQGACAPRAFVFEHIGADQQPGLDKFDAFNKEARRLATADDLFRFLDWQASGWPDAKLFKPLMAEVVASRAAILAGNPALDATRRTAKSGIPALETATTRALALDQSLAPALADDLLGELEASHCGAMPRSAFGNMASAQRLRDATMADVALKAESARNVVILAGNGHVRSDRGIPWYLRLRAPGRKVVAAAFVETEDGKTDATSYGPRAPDGMPAADYIAFALPAAREDPCEAMRQRMKK